MTPDEAMREAADAIQAGRIDDAHMWFGLAADLRVRELAAPGSYHHAELQMAIRGRRALAELRTVLLVVRHANALPSLQPPLPFRRP